MRGPADVVNKGFLHSDGSVALVDGAVFPGGLPVALLGGAVGPGTVTVLAVEDAEEVPFQVLGLELRHGGKVPGLKLVDVDDGDVVVAGEVSGDLALEVEDDELFVGGVESKAGTEARHGLNWRKREKWGLGFGWN